MSVATPAADGTMLSGLTILDRPLAGSALLRDYHAGLHLEPFYSGHPGDITAYERKAAEVDGRLSAAARAGVADAIESLGDAAERVSRILAGNGYFITTGQQPALFGGPMYTLYKVLAAIRLAAALEARLDKPCVALFWIGADDHDWDEANHASVIDTHGYVRRIDVHAPADTPPLPMSERGWGADVTRAVEEFVHTLPAGAWRDAVAAHVRDVYLPHATVAESFTATMRWLLRDRRVALVSSAHPLVRRAAAPVLRHDADNIRYHADAITRQTARLEGAGYRAQVVVDGDAANIMLLDENGRDRLVRTRTGWMTRRDKQGMTDAVLHELLDTQPQHFSPNVFLRPIVESALFPTIAYVAGPAEVSYFAQIGCLFAAHGILPPIVVPRRSVLLVDTSVQRVLDRLALEPDALRQPFEQLLGTVMRRDMPAGMRSALDRTRAALLHEYESLGDAAAHIDPTLRAPMLAARNAALHRLHHAEKKIIRQLKRQNSELAEQLRRASARLQPGGAPQERVFTPLHYIAQHGLDFVAAVERALDMTPAGSVQWRGPHCG